ncbi:MAG: acylneuraminate cytidylyltransferase family protein [Planctomycetes bacterium]|nr:acylneuraminate cytidylyltransferase family protein [Planctomycetota bacterium]
MKVVAIIPARGGSKSIPLKNIKSFCGKPLLVHSIETALGCSTIDRTIVSTDSEQIATVAKEACAEVPFLRPAEFAQDDALDLPVFLHCLDWLKANEGYEPDIIVHLRPTSPLRTVVMVEKAIHKLIENPRADSVRSVCTPSQNPFKMWSIDKDGFLSPLIKIDIYEQWNQPRQKLPKVYWQNGYVDVTRRTTLIKKHSMTGDKILSLVIEDTHIIDIDNQVTFELAEKIYQKNCLKL